MPLELRSEHGAAVTGLLLLRFALVVGMRRSQVYGAPPDLSLSLLVLILPVILLFPLGVVLGANLSSPCRNFVQKMHTAEAILR